MIRVLHKECGETAFFFLKKLKSGDPIRASNVVLLDGTPATPEMPIVCGSCGSFFTPSFASCEQQHWTDWFINASVA
ncbi:hypothetical protein KAR91_42630 [Candidatus Pacearchaeota archaeon]|nr:hypothetical protein [Candidatus Pacearchaeota archaeon]